MALTIGSDPELILSNGGHIVSCHDAGVPGSKTTPFDLRVGAVHRDNVLMELNVPPASNEQQWVELHHEVLNGAMEMVRSGTELFPEASAEFDYIDLMHPEAMAFGCDPDFDAWKLDTITQPSASRFGGFRAAGGHIHIGFDNPNDSARIDVVKMADIYLGLPSVLMDKDTKRRAMYGQASRYRSKPYGVEYRSLSNFWMFNDDYMRWAYRNAVRAYEDRLTADTLSEEDAKLIKQAINNYDKDLAETLCSRFNSEVIYAA